jgi:hypothetical protein
MDIKNELLKYINSNMEQYERSSSMPTFGIAKKSKSAFYSEETLCRSCYSDEANIDNYINENKEYNDFQTLLFKYIDERNLKDSDVYNKVHIDRRLFSKIRSDKDYHPSKETIILLGLSLELSEKEIVKLLESASYSLPKNNHYDLIIRFCFINNIYSINKVNELLEDYNCKLFSY